MRGIFILSLVSFATNVCVGQYTDSFTDGDFTANPIWSGMPSDFVVNGSVQLQLNNTVAATSYLTTAFSKDLSLFDVEWQGYVSQTFSPSGSNFGRIYLVSDQADLTQPLQGYYIQLGEAGSLDAPELFRQSGTTRTSVCRAASSGSIAASFALRYKVTRSGAGQWQLFMDYTGGSNFTLEATGTDATFTQSSFGGVECVYTITNAAKFFFDDFSLLSAPIPDTSPPVLQSIALVNNATLDIAFSEMLDLQSATMLSHYTLDQSIGNPASATLQSDNKTVRLVFSNSFKNGHQHQLSVAGVKDLAGNGIALTSQSFLFFQAVPVSHKNIIITEIMADPNPQVGMPDAEFIEVYNRTNDPYDLASWKFSDGSSVASLPSQIILPDEYWIITAAANVSKFSGNIHVIAAANFPTLNNDGDALTLKSPTGLTIDSVNYNLDWYRSVDKQEGGWSLELIDPENTCGEEDNWTAAEAAAGGTPGKQNSVKANKPDVTGPKLLSVIPLLANQLLVSFDEKLEATVLPTSFVFIPPVEVAKSEFTGPSLKEIKLDLAQDLVLRQLYTLEVMDVLDCTGNLIHDEYNSLTFALPEEADSLDLLINEVLFNPRPNGVDFVEVYNSSPKYINLKNWKLGNFENGKVSDSKEITTMDFMIGPNRYLAFTADMGLLQQQYPAGDPLNFYQVALPSLNDDEGSIALLNPDNKIMDYFSYSNKYHSALIKDEEGVSLERISFQQPTNDKSNWKSTSSVSGFATPGFINSNTRPENAVDENSISVDPEIFSPTANEFAKINYRFDQSNFVANVKIYDQQGHLVKTIANNETLGLEGFLRWDGDSDRGAKARMGYYVVWFEVIDLSGGVKTYRKRVVVATNN